MQAQQNQIQQATTPAIDDDDIGGVVTSRFGPEAGVWVIAETNDLGTRFAKIAVTDERGRYVMPDLPKAHYQVWVRGYGLVDSARSRRAGQDLNLTAVTAPNLAAAAQYYPAAYWYSMLKIPDQSRFPGTGRQRQRHPGELQDAAAMAATSSRPMAAATATRSAITRPGTSPRSSAISRARKTPGCIGWRSARPGTTWCNFITQLMTPDGGQLAALADWTDRIKAGELPAAARRGRSVLSATWSSPCATGSTRSTTCTI